MSRGSPSCRHQPLRRARPEDRFCWLYRRGNPITNLLNRFYDVQKGASYDRLDIRDICKDSLRRHLGRWFFRTPICYGTIADNIRFGRLDATQQEIEHAASWPTQTPSSAVCPQGYATRITADGANLSQGQRQLIAIARARP